MNWLVIQQSMSGQIRYLTNINSEVSYIGYWKLFDWLNDLHIVNIPGIRDEIDRQEAVFINVDTRLWEIYKDNREDHKPATFKELNELNTKKEVKTDLEKAKGYMEKTIKIFQKGFEKKVKKRK